MRRSVESILFELRAQYPEFEFQYTYYPGFKGRVWIFCVPGGSYQKETSVQSLRRRLVRAREELLWFKHLALPGKV